MSTIDRRELFRLIGVAGLGTFALRAGAADSPAAAELPKVPDEFPTQSPALAREMVGVSHGNLARVRELLALHPTLCNATWDWGFGDWESALGAASHMGNKEIASALLAAGARASIFSAAMLGQLAVVRAFVEASPGVQGTRGPHGITLLAHARAGGDAAKPVVDYLAALGGADPVPKEVELSPEAAARYIGVYTFGARDVDRIEISIDKGRLRLARTGATPRNLFHVGEHAFHPAGAPAVRIKFGMSEDKASELSIHDPGPVLHARRLS